MNVGKTLFAQMMEFVPWKTFGRIVERHKGDVGVSTLSCADQFRVMAFAQITWRESLRDITACLAARSQSRANTPHLSPNPSIRRNFQPDSRAPGRHSIAC